jgi:(p)ppGpp synthase/HD superfamily hydrolase
MGVGIESSEIKGRCEMAKELSKEVLVLLAGSKVNERAMLIAMVAHAGQYRRDGVTPYIVHPMSVASKVLDAQKAVAWLHDVLEDCEGWEAVDLIALGIPANVVESVVALTKVNGIAIEDYMEGVMRNWDALIVKIADMKSNMAGNPSEKARLSYGKWLPILQAKYKEVEKATRKIRNRIIS